MEGDGNRGGFSGCYGDCGKRLVDMFADLLRGMEEVLFREMVFRAEIAGVGDRHVVMTGMKAGDGEASVEACVGARARWREVLSGGRVHRFWLREGAFGRKSDEDDVSYARGLLRVCAVDVAGESAGFILSECERGIKRDEQQGLKRARAADGNH